jgi:capsular polysaccharide biosynthesis protein
MTEVQYFNQNIDQLHHSLGNWNDLDRLYATCELDTSFKYIIQKFNLISHYNIHSEDSSLALQKAIKHMRSEQIKIEKTETGLLRIHVWDKNPKMASDIANEFMNYIETKNRMLQTQYNQNLLESIRNSILEKSSRFKTMSDSLKYVQGAERVLVELKVKNTLNEIEELEKIANQYQLAVKAQQPSLLVIDKAYPNLKHDSPKRLYTLLTILVTGLIFSIFSISILESFILYHKRNASLQA